eukprot:m.218758 g.218758  ORF g.218758 m.218758 type:complete len:79 (+) comp39904_c0_seq14:331-567(+)
MIAKVPYQGRLPVRLAGPDIASNLDYYDRFLKALGDKVIGAATVHHFYENGKTAKLSDFQNPDLLDSLRDTLMGQKTD